MSNPSRAINRVSISELPDALSVKDNDYLILQSDGVSSKIKLADFKLKRTNLAFYNEVVNLHESSVNHQTEIEDIKAQLDTLASKISTLESSLNTLLRRR